MIELDDMRTKQRIEQGGVNDKRRKVQDLETSCRDKRVTFDRIMENCHNLNNHIDFEIRNKEMLVSSIKQLEQERVTLLKNNERYDSIVVEIDKKLKDRSA